ncbi:MAG TPA: hypothetical protein VLF68_01545, partial [Candidatus Saccharimonadales bacterium]|nr:hypothetical protein [Candidatus Saccharimonadales bacterium]
MKGQNLLIATFSVWREKKRTAINGMVEPLLTFFFPEFETIDLIDGAHPGDEETRTRFEYYQNKKLKKTDFAWISFLLSPFLKLQNTNGTQIVFKLRDFLSVLELSIRKRKRYDLFIGLESVFTLSGIVLKKLGVVKTVVYYVSDYAPNRYSQKLLNNIYLWLDRTCCYYADFIWDVSPA